MTPTANLRFVEREAGFEQYDVKVTERHGTEVCYRQKIIRVLQQWWEDSDSFDMITARPTGEWRDVPLHKDAP
jgi:hypothetical protein